MSKTSAEDRYQILIKIANLIDEHLEVLALAETTDNGKPLWLSKEWISRVLPAISDFLQPASCTLQQKATTWKARPSTIPCAIP